MAEFRPREFYFHSCEAAASAHERQTIPLHYYLKRGDIIAYRRELRAGTSPFTKDEFGNSVIDIAIKMLEDLLTQGLCTSFPIDDLISTLKTEALLPAKFCQADRDELYEGLYTSHERALYATFAQGDPNIVRPVMELETQKYVPEMHQGYPPTGHEGAAAALLSKKDIPPCTDMLQKHPDPSAPSANAQEKKVLVALTDCVSRPMSHQTRTRLQRLIRKLHVYIGVFQELRSCDKLFRDTLETRRQFDAVERKHLNSAASAIWLKHMGLPYLYITCIRLMLDMYPNAPDGVQWRSTCPSDIRVMCGLVCKLELPGFEVLLFLADYCTGLSNYLSMVTLEDFAPSEPTMQYLLHMAFVLDVPQLFKQIAELAPPQAFHKSIFSWKTAYNDLVEAEKANPASAPQTNDFLEVLKEKISGKDRKTSQTTPTEAGGKR